MNLRTVFAILYCGAVLLLAIEVRGESLAKSSGWTSLGVIKLDGDGDGLAHLSQMPSATNMPRLMKPSTSTI